MGFQFVDKADLWKSALLLNLKLRDRFRIAVDDHRGRAAVFSPDGYFSSTIHRWVTRFRNFRCESLPSPPAFYRRRGFVSSPFFSRSVFLAIDLTIDCFCLTFVYYRLV